MKNLLTYLLDKFCSDKGSFFLSRHHYSVAYHAILESRRFTTRNLIEIGIGDDTAPSIGAWLEYFPMAHIYALDIKTRDEFDRRQREGITQRSADRLKQAHNCIYDADMWKNARVHLNLDTNAADYEQISDAELPITADVIIDDGSHTVWDQEATLNMLWPLLSHDGVYIIEDLFVGSLPWSPKHDTIAPTTNTDCKHECYFPQKPSEHPFMFDRFNVSKKTLLRKPTQEILRDNNWFWTITGVHRGGGLDCALVIYKSWPETHPCTTMSGHKILTFASFSLLIWILSRVSFVRNRMRRHRMNDRDTGKSGRPVVGST